MVSDWQARTAAAQLSWIGAVVAAELLGGTGDAAVEPLAAELAGQVEIGIGDEDRLGPAAPRRARRRDRG